MSRTKSICISRAKEPACETTVESPNQGRGRGTARGRGRGRGCARGSTPTREYDRGISPEPLLEPRKHRASLKVEDPMTIQGTLQWMMGIVETIARDALQRLARGEVPPPQVPEKPQHFDLFVVDHSTLVGKTPYMPPNVLVDTPAQMVPPAQLAHKPI